MLQNLRLMLAVTLFTTLAACTTAKTDQAADSHAANTQAQNNSNSLFNDAPAKDKGWQGLANLLEAMSPSVDTSVPLSPAEITNRIALMLDQGQNQAALDIIEKRELQLKDSVLPGSDVQLLFLRARALAALGQHNNAIATYQNMTILYPELPEPWNNLAAEYVKQGKLDMANDALTMALTADPHYQTARINLSEVLKMQAQRLLEPKP